MNRERWVQIQELFNRVVECDPGQRIQLLEEVGTTDPELRREVEALLSCHGSADEHLRAAVREEAGVIALSFANDSGETAFVTSTMEATGSGPGSVIGPYHLLQLIGEGGMGEVWLAEQKQPVRRRVALKLIKAGMDTREVVKRFASERQALALMDHPAIAKVFDAGSTSQGRPYFVMEHVAGVSITAYCDKHKLTTRERLELFVHVCEGVQHAHQKAVIHRDLKPSNILVSEIDGRPMPRIIDFGVAKATSRPLTAETMYTRAGAVLGTPGYMSPEQADSGGEDIDTRTDVYSLGVVLYELLVGALPLDLNRAPFDEVLRRLREQDAPKPSTKLRSMGAESTTTAQNRRTDPPTLARQLRGDLDSITLKALEKDRSRRYATPSEFAADIGRYLRNEPVAAHPPSVVYRVRKYIRRNRLAVAAAVALIVLLGTFAVAQAIQLRRVTQERDRATRERDRADRITQFMTGMFKVSNPSNARGNTIMAREILDKASNEIAKGLSNDPDLQAKMMYTMAETYLGLGLYTRAEPLLRRAIEINDRVAGGRKNPVSLRWRTKLGETLHARGRFREAEELQRRVLDEEHHLLGPNHPDTLRCMSDLGETLEFEGRFHEAEKIQRDTLSLQRRTLGPEDPDTLSTEQNLASIFRAEGRFADSEKMYRKLAELRSRRHGEDDPRTLFDVAMLSDVLRCERQFVESENFARKAFSGQRRVLGPDHANTLDSMAILAQTLQGEGRYKEAEELQRDSLERRRRSLGPDHPTTLRAIAILGSILNDEGRYTEAEKLEREALDIQRRLFGADNFDTVTSAYYLACTMALRGEKDQAIALLEQATAHAMPEIDGSIKTEPGFRSLHGDPRFEELVAKLR